MFFPCFGLQPWRLNAGWLCCMWCAFFFNQWKHCHWIIWSDVPFSSINEGIGTEQFEVMAAGRSHSRRPKNNSTGCADRSPCFAIWMYQVHMLHYWVATVFYFDGKPPGWSRPSKQAADVWIGITSYFLALEIVYENLLGHEHTSKRELNTSSHDHDDARGKPPLLIYPWRAQSTTEILDARKGKKIVAAGQLL